jgi:maltose-binding protein MalE
MKLIYLKSNFVLEPKTIKTYISIKKKVKKKHGEREGEIT